MVSDGPIIIKRKLYSGMLSGAQRGKVAAQKPHDGQGLRAAPGRVSDVVSAWSPNECDATLRSRAEAAGRPRRAATP
jgi:hypothetical protein